jgi:hypothetical protein
MNAAIFFMDFPHWLNDRAARWFKLRRRRAGCHRIATGCNMHGLDLRRGRRTVRPLVDFGL